MNRIVVIEDDPAILRGLADNLRMEPYEVLTAADGPDGFRVVCEAKPDLVILDLMLPGLNGYDVCRRMRGRGLDTPVLMLTSDDRESSRVQGFDAGADDYVSKPFSLRELLGRVRAILRRSARSFAVVNPKELDEARRIQRGLMPAEIPGVSGVRIGAVCQPAGIVGGDYFDVIKLRESIVAVCIADVCGKGLPAAMMMSNLQAAVRAHASEQMRPAELCAKVNRMMCANTPSNSFVSFFYGLIDTRTKRFRYCNAGHNPPILSRRNGLPKRLDCGGGVLGVFAEWSYEDDELEIAADDRLLMYTDGVTESENARGEEFGERRLIELVVGLQFSGAIELSEGVVRSVREFNNGRFEDDLTVVAVAVE
jgi:phosphoserine phosphatase RsbU/P